MTNPKTPTLATDPPDVSSAATDLDEVLKHANLVGLSCHCENPHCTEEREWAQLMIIRLADELAESRKVAIAWETVSGILRAELAELRAKDVLASSAINRQIEVNQGLRAELAAARGDIEKLGQRSEIAEASVQGVLENFKTCACRDYGHKTKTWGSVCMVHAAVKTRNDRLLEALEFYADPNHWHDHGVPILPDAITDAGQIARAAIEDPK